ncbi:MAG TPA: BrnA antitoxin family protein [Burkholderiaceae bacterium]|nr:BrnA antitoxin family protein [Burkholderiaceae bacterium]
MRSTSSPSAKRQKAKRSDTSGKSRTDWSRLFDLEEDAKPTAEHPQVDLRKVVRGIVRRGLRPAPSKTLISLRLDADVIEWFKAQGPGYQTRINAVLRAFRDAST